MAVPKTITVKTVGAAGTLLIVRSRLAPGQGPGHAPDQLAEADLATGAETGVQSMRKATGIDTGTRQLMVKEGSGRSQMAKKRAELYSLTLSGTIVAERIGISLETADLTRSKSGTDTTVVRVILAGIIIVMTGTTAETLLTANAEGRTDFIVTCLKVNT